MGKNNSAFFGINPAHGIVTNHDTGANQYDDMFNTRKPGKPPSDSELNNPLIQAAAEREKAAAAAAKEKARAVWEKINEAFPLTTEDADTVSEGSSNASSPLRSKASSPTPSATLFSEVDNLIRISEEGAEHLLLNAH